MAAPSEQKSDSDFPVFTPPLRIEKINEAVTIMTDLVKKRGENDLLFTEEEGVKIRLQLVFKKAPKSQKYVKIPLPNRLATDLTTVCLFVKDIDRKNRDYEETVNHYKDLLREKGVTTISEVIPLKSLHTEYKQYEAKRNLSNMYDMFLADERIASYLPRALGKHFYCRKRMPVQVNLENNDLKKEIDKATNNTRCFVTGRGTVISATVAHSGMTNDQITENVYAAARSLAKKIPGGPDNVSQLLLISDKVPSLPLFISTAPANHVDIRSRKRKLPEDEAEEITTVVGAKVKVTSNWDIVVIPDGQTEAPKPSQKREKTKRRKRTTFKYKNTESSSKRNVGTRGKEKIRMTAPKSKGKAKKSKD